jgi:hypothetical protein
MNFMNLLLLLEENSELFIKCIIIKLQEKIQYCVGRKTSEPISLNFCNKRNIVFSPVEFDDNAHDKKL